MEYFQLLLPLSLILFLSKLLGIFFKKIHVPQVLGMIIAGILIGLIGFIPNQNILSPAALEGLSFLAKLGVILIMFSAGIGTDLKSIKQTGVSSIVITILGVIVPMGLGFLVAGVFLGFEDIYSCLFYGVTLTATSVSVTVATLKELGKLNTKIGTAIVSAAIIDDINGIVLLSLIISLGGNSSASAPVWLTLIKMVAFFVIAIIVGFLARKCFAKIEVKHHKFRRLAIFAFALCFLFAYAAEEWFGVADITGAYIAGLVLSGLDDSPYVDRKTDILSYMIFAPAFFANIGITTIMQVVDGSFVISPSFILFGVCYVIVGLLGKFIGCGIGAKMCKFSFRDSFRAGVGMMVRAEVILVCAQKGITANMVDSAIIPFVLAIIIISSFVTPLCLKASYNKNFLPLKRRNKNQNLIA